MEENFCKVTFPLDTADWHGRATEDLWAVAIMGDKSKSLFCVRSTPFFTASVSKMDVVCTVRSDDGSSLDFTNIHRTGGHSTYMILAEPHRTDFNDHMEKLVALKCKFEATKIRISLGERILFSVDVPSEADIHKVYEVLNQADEENIWMFQRGHFGHELRTN